MIICSYFTDKYAIQAEKLRASCDALSLDHDVIPVDEERTWRLNVRKKIEVIQHVLAKYGEVLWVDADAVIVRKPTVWIWDQRKTIDFFARMRPPSRLRFERGLRGGISTGTMFLRSGSAVDKMISAWPECQDNAERSIGDKHAHEPGLFDAYMGTSNVRHYALPWEYIVVEGPGGEWARLVKNEWKKVGRSKPLDTIVAHFYTKASRRS